MAAAQTQSPKAQNSRRVTARRADPLRPEGFRANIGGLLLNTLTINVLSLALPVMTLQVYDRILPNAGSGTFPVLVMGVCVAVMLEALLRLARAYIIGRSGAAYEHRVACVAMARVLNADLSRMGAYGIGEHLHRMGSVTKLKDFYNGYALTVLAELAFVPLFFGLIVYIGRDLAAVPAFILGAFVMISLWKGYRLRDVLKAREGADNKRFDFLIEALEGVHTVKAFALEKFFERRYEALEEQSTRRNYDVTEETASIFNIGSIFSHIMVTAVISIGALFVLQGQLTTGALIATLLLSGRMMQPIQRTLALWARYQDYRLARKTMEELLATPQRQEIRRSYEKRVRSGGDLDMRDVGFSYATDDASLLEGISLNIRRGETVLISGAHGVGKTTLLKLMAGIYPATTGQIMIDGEDIQSFAPEDLVRHVGFIRATPMIFRGTIRNNITSFGQVSEAQAREVAALLHIDKDVARLAGGFDTLLSGNDTDDIAAGIKQRIAMVAALATKPRLILFDNADRACDREGYMTIYSLLARLKGKASMVLVSDDLNICSLADRHFVLQNGRLTEAEPVIGKSNIKPYKELRL